MLKLAGILRRILLSELTTLEIRSPTSYPQVPKASSTSWFSGQLQGETAWAGGKLWCRYTENCLRWQELLEIQKRWWALCLQLDFWSLHSSLYHQTQNFIWNRGKSHPSCWGWGYQLPAILWYDLNLTYHTFILMVTQLGHTPPEVPAMTLYFHCGLQDSDSKPPSIETWEESWWSPQFYKGKNIIPINICIYWKGSREVLKHLTLKCSWLFNIAPGEHEGTYPCSAIHFIIS